MAVFIGLRAVVGLRTVVGDVAGFVVERLGVPVVAGVVLVDLVVPRVLRGVVVGLLAGLVDGLLLGRLVLPPPIVPPPAAGSCCALVMLAYANRQTNAVRDIRGRRRVDIRFSPATQTAVAAIIAVRRCRLRLNFLIAIELNSWNEFAGGHYSSERGVVGTVSLVWSTATAVCRL